MMKWNEKLYEWTKNYGPLEWCIVAILLIMLVSLL
jgi:hypothetical protein